MIVSRKRAQRYHPQQQQQSLRRVIPYETKTVVLHNPEYFSRKKELQLEMQFLHNEASQTHGLQKTLLKAKIDEKVATWNEEHRGSVGHIDLHGMTPKAALDYVLRMVKEKGNRGKFEIITGKGLHSKDGRPRIKERLKEEFSNKGRCNIKEQADNSGRLILHLW